MKFVIRKRLQDENVNTFTPLWLQDGLGKSSLVGLFVEHGPATSSISIVTCLRLSNSPSHYSTNMPRTISIIPESYRLVITKIT